MKRVTSLLLAVAAFAPPTFAVDLVLGPVGDYPAGNSTLYLDVGEAVSIFVWAKRSGSSGYVNRLNVSLRGQSVDGGAIAGPVGEFSILNDSNYSRGPNDPLYSRWDFTGVVGGYNVGDLLIDNADADADSYRPGLGIEGAPSLFGYFNIVATHEGKYDLFFRVGDLGGVTETSGVATNRFGFGDDPVPNIAGAESGLPDLTIVIPRPPIPEPANVGAIGLGVGLITRRRPCTNA